MEEIVIRVLVRNEGKIRGYGCPHPEGTLAEAIRSEIAAMLESLSADVDVSLSDPVETSGVAGS